MNMDNLSYFDFSLLPFSARTMNLLDLALFSIIITLFALARFNEWAEAGTGRRPSKPSEYIARGRYLLFCLIYSLPFFLFSLLLFTLEFRVPSTDVTSVTEAGGQAPDNLNQLITGFFQHLGQNTLSLPLIYLLALINLKFFSYPELVWRRKLQKVAKIPENALRLKNDIINSYFAPYIDRAKRDYLLSRAEELGLSQRWKTHLENDDYFNDSPVVAYFLNATILYLSALELKAISQTDPQAVAIDRRLDELDLVLQRIDQEQRRQIIYADELRRIIDDLSEQIAKSIVRRWSDPKAQYQVMRSALHIGEFHDSPAIPVFKWLFSACALVFVGTYFSWFAYMEASGFFGAGAPDADNWNSWFLSSFSLYLACILVSVVAVVSLLDRKEGFDLTALLLVFTVSSAICYAYFLYFASTTFATQWVLLSIKHGLLAAAIFFSLMLSPSISRKVSAIRASKIALGFGIIAAPIQSLIIGEFRNIGWLDAPVTLLIAGIFGLVGTFLATIVCCFFVEEFKRYRHVNNRRRSMRVALNKGSDLSSEDQTYPVTLFDLSEKGARIQRLKAQLPEGTEAILKFQDTTIRAMVRWQNKNFIGLDFSDDPQSTPRLRRIIAQELQVMGSAAA